jgi:hypothetical protein
MGTEGELLIGGPGVARGYFGLPELTREQFVVLADGVRYYRSGDIVYLRNDGELMFCHRGDQQVKIRGFRVEPSEIEACLLAHPAVKECAVIACPGADGLKELHAFAVAQSQNPPEIGVVRDHVAARLPGYMVPALTWVSALPKNSSGKIDRRALVTAPPSLTSTPVAVVAKRPRGPVEEYLATLWQEILGHGGISADADFFEQGGHSLLAARLTARIGKSFRIDYPLALFFERPTIAGIAENLQRLVPDRPRLEKMAIVRLELARMTPQQMEARLRQLHSTENAAAR